MAASVIRALPAPPAVPHDAIPPPVPEPVPRLLRRKFILFNLRGPCNMLVRGVREFLVESFKGRPVGGHVRRVNNDDYGQAVVLIISGEENFLMTVENTVIAANTPEYWDYEMQEETVIPRFATQSFTITQSARGAVRGPNSDPAHDNKSETRAQSSKHSSRSGL